MPAFYYHMYSILTVYKVYTSYTYIPYLFQLQCLSKDSAPQFEPQFILSQRKHYPGILFIFQGHLVYSALQIWHPFKGNGSFLVRMEALFAPVFYFYS